MTAKQSPLAKGMNLFLRVFWEKYGMMKSIIILSSVMLSVSAHAYRYDFEYDGMYFLLLSLEKQECVLTGFNSVSRDTVVIPEIINYLGREIKVVDIFNSWEIEKVYDTIKYLSIPGSINLLGSNIFTDLPELRTLVIEGAGRELRFYGNCQYPKLEYLKLGRDVEPPIFKEHPMLRKVEICDSLEYLSEHYFEGCTNLESVNLGGKLKYVGNDAFSYTRIDSLEVPPNVERIVGGAFSNTPLKYVHIQKSQDGLSEPFVMEQAFGQMLEKIVIERPITTIDYNVEVLSPLRSDQLKDIELINIGKIPKMLFNGCKGIKNIKISGEISEIGSCAFKQCEELESFQNIEGLEPLNFDNIAYIGSYAFNGCKKMNHLIMPENLTSIERGVYSNCTFPEILVIPDAVEDIGEEAFYGCENVKLLKIGKNCKRIEKMAFYKDGIIPESNGIIPEIMCESVVPPGISDYTFSGATFMHAVLYVPEESLEAYSSAAGWKQFWNIKTLDQAGIDEVHVGNKYSIQVQGGELVIQGAENSSVRVFTPSGKIVYNVSCYKGDPIRLSSGIYIININGTSHKISL